MDKIVTITFKMYESEAKLIELYARQCNMNKSRFIREAIRHYIRILREDPNKCLTIDQVIYEFECPICGKKLFSAFYDTLLNAIKLHMIRKHKIDYEKYPLEKLITKKVVKGV